MQKLLFRELAIILKIQKFSWFQAREVLASSLDCISSTFSRKKLRWKALSLQVGGHFLLIQLQIFQKWDCLEFPKYKTLEEISSTLKFYVSKALQAFVLSDQQKDIFQLESTEFVENF